MKKTLFILVLAAFILLLAACNDPVFHMISQEIEVLPPYISGSPTNFVIFNGDMFIASGHNLNRYRNDGEGYIWSKSMNYSHRILQIAGPVGGNLYALFLNEDNNERYIQQIDTENNMPLVAANKIDDDDIYDIQSIYSANGYLFISAGNNDHYDIYYYDGINIEPISGVSNAGRLNGVVYTSSGYFLSTTRENNTIGGIFHLNTALTITSVIPDSNIGINGIIVLENNTSVVAIDRNGVLHNVTPSSITTLGVAFPTSPQRYSSGALAIANIEGEKRLIAGRQDSLQTSTNTGYSYGYLDLVLGIDGSIIDGSSFREPDIRNFPSSIGRNPVNSIIQGPCGTIFASTQKNGVWSLRTQRNGFFSWNSEQQQ